MKNNYFSFRLPFNLLSLLLTIGLVAFISDRATIHGSQRIDENLKRVEQVMSAHSGGNSWSIEHMPSLVPSKAVYRPPLSSPGPQLVAQ